MNLYKQAKQLLDKKAAGGELTQKESELVNETMGFIANEARPVSEGLMSTEELKAARQNRERIKASQSYPDIRQETDESKAKGRVGRKRKRKRSKSS